MLKCLREDLKKNKVKIPKVTHLGNHFQIGDEHIEVHGEECNYSKRICAIRKYMEIKGIELNIDIGEIASPLTTKVMGIRSDTIL